MNETLLKTWPNHDCESSGELERWTFSPQNDVDVDYRNENLRILLFFSSLLFYYDINEMLWWWTSLLCLLRALNICHYCSIEIHCNCSSLCTQFFSFSFHIFCYSTQMCSERTKIFLSTELSMSINDTKEKLFLQHNCLLQQIENSILCQNELKLCTKVMKKTMLILFLDCRMTLNIQKLKKSHLCNFLQSCFNTQVSINIKNHKEAEHFSELSVNHLMLMFVYTKTHNFHDNYIFYYVVDVVSE